MHQKVAMQNLHIKIKTIGNILKKTGRAGEDRKFTANYYFPVTS